MGAGAWGAGSIPAGNDVSRPGTITPPFAQNEFYTPNTRIVIVNADGTVAQLNYVDQEVAFAWGIPLRSLPSSPTVGLDWAAIRKATDASAFQTITTQLQRAAAALIRMKAITMGTVVVGPGWPGTRQFRVPYTNNVTAAQQGRIATVGG